MNALGAVLSLGSQFNKVPGVSSILGAYGDAGKSIAKNIDKIATATFEKDLTNFEVQDCDLLHTHSSPSSQGFWDKLQQALSK